MGVEFLAAHTGDSRDWTSKELLQYLLEHADELPLRAAIVLVDEEETIYLFAAHLEGLRLVGALAAAQGMALEGE